MTKESNGKEECFMCHEKVPNIIQHLFNDCKYNSNNIGAKNC